MNGVTQGSEHGNDQRGNEEAGKMKISKRGLTILQSANWSDFPKRSFPQASVNKLVRDGLLISISDKWVTWYSLTDSGRQVLINNGVKNSG